MTRQESYIAELTQLLFYMTPWDKAEVLKGINAMINHPETGLKNMEELGNPMKLAVTLHRQYTPTPEPTEEAPVEEEAPVVEEAPVEEEVSFRNYEERIGQEKIFAEIFTAATEAQSAVSLDADKGAETVRKARYWFLLLFVPLAVIVGVPATLIFAMANVAVFSVTLVSLAAVVYLVIFQLLPAAVFASKLILLGLTLLMAVVTLLLGTMTVWFLRTATIGFPRFLIEIARKYGYREVEVQ